jgi:hypothetical protein
VEIYSQTDADIILSCTSQALCSYCKTCYCIHARTGTTYACTGSCTFVAFRSCRFPRRTCKFNCRTCTQPAPDTTAASQAAQKPRRFLLTLLAFCQNHHDNQGLVFVLIQRAKLTRRRASTSHVRHFASSFGAAQEHLSFSVPPVRQFPSRVERTAPHLVQKHR